MKLSTRRFLTVFYSAVAAFVSSGVIAATIVNSVFTGSVSSLYSNTNNWSPAKVPNNIPGTNYNVTISLGLMADLDVDATVSRFTLSEAGTQFKASDHNFTVTGATTDSGSFFNIISLTALNSSPTFALGAVTNFSGTTLSNTSFWTITDSTGGARTATFQFNGANIVTLKNALIFLTGPGSRIVDEHGNDGLRNLAHVEGGSFNVVSRNFTTGGNFTNDGILTVEVDPTLVLASGFKVKGRLTNFDAATHTLNGGNYGLKTRTASAAALKFTGADIINNAAELTLDGPLTQVLDENGNDALRNFAHNLGKGQLLIRSRDLMVSGAFTNDGALSVESSINTAVETGGPARFIIHGSLTNLDSATHTLAGGEFIGLFGAESQPAILQFKGADIVHNATTLTLSAPARIVDENGTSGLRNFADNEKEGTLDLAAGFSLNVPGDFTNAGEVTIENSFGLATSTLTVAAGHGYRQTSGTTALRNGLLAADNVSIDAGILTGRGTVKGNVGAPGGTLRPHEEFGNQANPLAINGNLSLTYGSSLELLLAGNVQGANYDVVKVKGTTGLGGELSVSLASGYVPGASDSFTVVTSGSPLTGSFTNVHNGGRLATNDRTHSFLATYSGKNLVLSNFQSQAISKPPQLLNISTRLRVLTGDNVLIGGFIITGTNPKKVIVRAIGPSISSNGVPVPGRLANPTLELHDQTGALIATNDNWKINDKTQQSQEAEIKATGVPPTNDLESAIVTTLPANNASYTVIVRGKNGIAGIGLVEAYDLGGSANSMLANISTRGFVDTNDNVMIGGFILGPGTATGKVLVRAIGPSLSANGVPLSGRLENPTLELHGQDGDLIASNDNWKDMQAAEIQATTIPPSNDNEAAILVTLTPGNYTAVVRGKNNMTGVGLVEVYNLQ